MPANDRDGGLYYEKPGYVELRGAVVALSNVQLLEADSALLALADAKHRYHADTLKALLVEPTWHERGTQGWTNHPYCLAVLARALENPGTRSLAVGRLRKLVVGLPQKDDDIKGFIERNRDKFRRAPAEEEERLGGFDVEPRFVVGNPPKAPWSQSE
jgi:hypothetical protein